MSKNGGLLKNVAIQRPTSAASAGTGESTGDMIDMSGFESCLLLLHLGLATSTAVVTLTAKQGATTTSTGAATLAGTTCTVTETTAGVADNQILAMDIVNPTDRYIWPIVTITTANCVIDGITAIQYGAKAAPTTHKGVYHAVTNITPAEA